MPKPPTLDPEAHLSHLPTDKLAAFLAALAKGDLEAAKKAGGGLSRVQLAALLPDGDTGTLLDGLEKQAAFLLWRQARLALLGVLPWAIEAMRGLIQAPASILEARASIKPEEVVPPQQPGMYATFPHERERAAAIDALPNPKIMEQRRHALALLFTLAKDLRLDELAASYKAEDEESELQRMAAAQGLPYVPPLGMREEVKPRVQ